MSGAVSAQMNDVEMTSSLLQIMIQCKSDAVSAQDKKMKTK